MPVELCGSSLCRLFEFSASAATPDELQHALANTKRRTTRPRQIDTSGRMHLACRANLAQGIGSAAEIVVAAWRGSARASQFCLAPGQPGENMIGVLHAAIFLKQVDEWRSPTQ